MSSHIKYMHTKKDVIYLQSFKDTYLAPTLLYHLILTRMSWLQPRRGLCKAGRCEFVGFVKTVTDYKHLGCVLFYNCGERKMRILYQLLFYNISP